jgi:fermentation-respiration switch protein FrsA (DUF1100 family)
MFASGARVDPAPLTCPIAVWHGEDNPAVPVKESVLAFSNHPTTQLHILRNAGLYLTQPVFEEIFGWLAETSAPDTSRRAGEQPEQWKTAP